MGLLYVRSELGKTLWRLKDPTRDSANLVLLYVEVVIQATKSVLKEERNAQLTILSS